VGLVLLRPVDALAAHKDVLFQRGEFGFIRDRAEDEPLQVVVGGVAGHVRPPSSAPWPSRTAPSRTLALTYDSFLMMVAHTALNAKP
jgi:hypothetical protein